MVEETGDLLTGVESPPTEVNWKDSVSKEHRGVIDRFGTVPDLAKGYAELDKSASGKVKIPTEESSAEEISAFYEKIGRPKDAKDYEIAKPDMPEGMEYSEDMENAMRSVAHEAGLTQRQMQMLAKSFNEYQVKVFGDFQSEMQRTHEEGERVLKESWGAEYDKNLEIAKRACKELGGEDFVELLVASKLGNNPIFVKTFHDIGLKILDDTFIKGEKPPAKKEEYVPANINSPGMYANDESEDGKKARAYFEAQGYVY